jgi:cation diffusion facilitator CzcD-associated flavoprotein CzcO
MTTATHQQEATSAVGEPRHVRIGILGAGFGGLGMAIRLRQEGIEDFVIWERHEDVGGTWWANTYPGCQCDIPSHLYSFSFAPNPEWSRTYPMQPELRDYLRRCAERFELIGRIRFGCEVMAAEWDEAVGRWRVDTSDGPFTADVLVAAPGPLSEPSIPDVPGLGGFEGEVFHTATWNHDYDLRGKRVAVVGTGASAIQAVPAIQPLVEHLTVFQRTPPWVVPHRDRPITERERRAYRRFPLLQRLARAGVYFGRELLVPGLAYQPRIMKVVERLARENLRRQIPGPELRERLTPDYAIGCKRILPSSSWYRTLMQPNVDVVTSAVEEVRPNGVVAADGSVRDVDMIIFATGFYVTDIPIAPRVRGVGGTRLSEVWDGSPRAYRGTAVAGFPNFFLLVGPNTGLGHNSIVFMIEAQLAYVMDALKAMRRGGAGRIEVRREAQEAYNAKLQERMERTVWTTGGCSSWYIDSKGKNTTIWPDFTFRFWNATRRFDPEAYELAPAPAAVTT